MRIIPKYFARLEQHEKSSCVKGNFISAGHGIETREAESAFGPGWCHSHCVARFGWNGPAPACPAVLPACRINGSSKLSRPFLKKNELTLPAFNLERTALDGSVDTRGQIAGADKLARSAHLIKIRCLSVSATKCIAAAKGHVSAN